MRQSRRWGRRVARAKLTAAGSVAVLSAALAGALPAVARGRRTRSTPTYAPRFHRLASDAAVYAAGNLRLIGSLGSSGADCPDAATLVNVVTRTRQRIVAPQGCDVAGLSASAVTFDCTQASYAIAVEHLPSGQIAPLATYPHERPAVGSVGAQMCGSHTIHRYAASGFATNSRIVIWIHRDVLYGLDGRDGRRFTIEFPRRLASTFMNTVAINNRDIYVQTSRTEQIWTATIPSALR